MFSKASKKFFLASFRPESFTELFHVVSIPEYMFCVCYASRVLALRAHAHPAKAQRLKQFKFASSSGRGKN